MGTKLDVTTVSGLQEAICRKYGGCPKCEHVITMSGYCPTCGWESPEYQRYQEANRGR